MSSDLSSLGLTLADVDLGGTDAESDPRLDEYFVTTPYVQRALVGRRTTFLGRKGSGKSALFTQLGRLVADSEMSSAHVISLTPDQYSWSALRSYEEQGIGAEHAHTNAWKLSLLIELASGLTSIDRTWSATSEESIARLREFLKANFGALGPTLPKTTSSLLKGLTKFNFSAFGFGVGVEQDAGVSESIPITPALLAALTESLAQPIAEQPVIVALDRIDDSWDGSTEAESLIVGLLKAAKELNDRLGPATADGGLRVLVFLRSDMYDAASFDDKDKHRSTEQHISWTGDELRTMLARRLPIGTDLDCMFEEGDMRGSPPFNYIVKRTFLRPREVLQFTEEAIRLMPAEAHRITKVAIRGAEEQYSRWKVDDLKQEYSKAVPYFGLLLEALRQGKHRYDSLQDLVDILSIKVPDLVTEHGARRLLEVLFDSSVIGVRLGNSGSPRFKCEDSGLVLPNSGGVYVHQSLHKGLNITELRRASSGEALADSLGELEVELLRELITSEAVRDLTYLGLSPSPADLLLHDSFSECASSLGSPLTIDEVDREYTISTNGTISRGRLAVDEEAYTSTRDQLRLRIDGAGSTVDEYLKAQ